MCYSGDTTYFYDRPYRYSEQVAEVGLDTIDGNVRVYAH